MQQEANAADAKNLSMNECDETVLCSLEILVERTSFNASLDAEDNSTSLTSVGSRSFLNMILVERS